MSTQTIDDLHTEPTGNAMPGPASSGRKELQAQAEWLLRNIDRATDNVRRKRNRNQKWATRVRLSAIALSGLGTILLGLQIAGLEKWFKEFAFVLSALVTLTSSIEPFFNFRALWVEHERAIYRFHVLRDDIDFYLAGTNAESLSAEKLGGFQERYRVIWANLSETWLEQRQSNRYGT